MVNDLYKLVAERVAVTVFPRSATAVAEFGFTMAPISVGMPLDMLGEKIHVRLAYTM